MPEHEEETLEDFEEAFSRGPGRKPRLSNLTEGDPFELPEDSEEGIDDFKELFGGGGFDPGNLPQPSSSELMRAAMLRGQRNNLEYNQPPTLIDQNEIMADVIGWLDGDVAFNQIVNHVLTSPAAILTHPEMIKSFNDMWDDNLEQLIKDGIEPAYAELQQTIMWGSMTNITEALYTTVNPNDEDPANAFNALQNVSTLFDEHSSQFNAEQNELMWAILAGLPEEQFKADIARQELGPTAAAGVLGIFDTFGSASQISQELLPRDVREELAAEATLWLRQVESSGGFAGEDQKRDFIVWFYMTAQEKTGEIESRQSALGVAGGILDLPKEAVTLGVNTLLQQIIAPNDSLNRTSLSLGQNVAIAMGMNPGDAAGTSILNNPIAKIATKPLQYGVNAIPLVAAWSAQRKLRGGSVVGTPLIGGLVDAYEQSSSYEFVSGSTDLLSWIVLDPINYFGAAGFGVKFAKTIPRAAGLSRSRLFLRGVLPFYGPRAVGVRGGFTTRAFYAGFSKTMDEMVDVAKGSHKGRQVYNTMLISNTAEEVASKLNGIPEPLADFLMKTAKTGQGEDFFWETFRSAGHGWNEAGNPGRMDVLHSLMNGFDRQLIASARARMAEGTIGIRSLARGVFGSATDEVFEVVLRAGAFDEGVTSRIEKLARLGDSPALGDAILLDDGAELVVRQGHEGTLAGFIDGEFVGGIEGAVPAAREGIGTAASAAVLPSHRERGIFNALKSKLSAEGQQALLDASQQSEAFRVATQQPSSSVYRASQGVEDGRTKTVISSKWGWKEFNLGQQEQLNQLIVYLTENGQIDLAAKLQNLHIPGVLEQGISSLDDAERAILRNWLDNFAQYDVLRLEDELLFARRAEPKLITGADVAGTAPVEQVLKNEMYDSAIAFATRAQLKARTHELMVTHRMPAVASGAIARRKIANFIRLNSRSRIAQFIRRFRSSLANPIPHDVSFQNAGEGGANLRRFMRMMGVGSEDVDDWMGRWWSANTVEERRTAFLMAVQDMGDKLDNPHLRFGLHEFWQRHGEHMFHQTTDGREIGVGLDIAGNQKILPFTKRMMTDSVPLPNIHQMQQTQRRYRFGSKHPNLTAGFGGTADNRVDLAKAYASHINRTYGPETLKGISNDNLLAMAYADVIGFQGRENGLGLVNRIYQGVSRGYNMFHTTFTYAQLALRPFAWSSRINLEEHARGWMMGLPTLFKQPTMYFQSLWDAHFLGARPKLYRQQAAALNRSVNDMFGGGDTARALNIADEILPGFTARAAEAGLVSEDALRSAWISEVERSLFGAADAAPFGARGNLARRTILRGNRLKRSNARMMDRYKIPDIWTMEDDVPEMLNKFNVWTFADELSSSVQRLDFTRQTRAGDVPAYGAAWLQKTHQIVNDQGGRFALQRMLETLSGAAPQYTPARFTRTAYWHDVRDNVLEIARYRGHQFDTEADLAEFYLDVLMRDDLIESHFGGLWGTNLQDRTRIIGELASGRSMQVRVGEQNFSLGLRDATYADGKQAAGELFEAQYNVGNYNFPAVGGFFNPMQGNHGGKNPFRRMADSAMHTFGEEVSQTLHRRPSYLAERRRWGGVLEGLGWGADDAASYAHQKAFEFTNWTFFNNQHVGATVHRMNKVVPFFSAWAEVLGTWAWKVPSANFAPIGYVNMIHKIDRFAQGLVNLGIVEINESGQWYLALDDDPRSTVPAGNALSAAGFGMMQTPVTVAEQITNLARWAIAESGIDEDFDKPADFSAWRADNYQLAIGSPIRINSHGIMGVNQFQFGFSPILNFAASSVMRKAPYAGDTKLIDGDSLADMFDALPTDVGTAEFLEINERELLTIMSEDEYNLLFAAGGFTPDVENIDTSTLSLQVPRSSWLDGVIDDTFFPFGRVETPSGIIRELVPASVGYMLRGSLGIYADEHPFAEGILNVITGPTEQYQIDAAINREILGLEADEGLITQATNMSQQLLEIVSKEGFDSIEEYVRSAEPGTPISERFTRIKTALDNLDDEIMKRATDRAHMTVFARGLMGFFGPASPRMFHDEQEVTARWYAGREMAEAAQVRGSLLWADALNDLQITSADDLDQLMGIINQWYQDPNGSQVKAWFMDTYPNLLAWTQPITFYGPAGAPPAVRDIDNFFDDLEEGRRQTYPEDVLIQRVARTAVQASREGQIIHDVGTNDPWEQAQWFISNPIVSTELRDKYRMKMKALDMWDDELNNGAYMQWRERNEADHPTRFEQLEEEFYIMQDVLDDIVALTKLADLEPEDQKAVMIQLGIVMRTYGESLFRLKEEITEESDYLVPREEIIGEYYLQINTPYYEARQELFDKFDETETRDARSVIWEEIRDLENESHLDTHQVHWGGQSISVPGPLQRAWDFKEPEEQHNQVLEWIGKKPEWLSLFATSKMVDAFPGVEDYLATTPVQARIYADATELKNQAVEAAREDPTTISRYERDQFITKVNDWVLQQLDNENRNFEADWIEAWPIERLRLAGQLPTSLEEIASWYMAIRQDLESREEPLGPGSEIGRRQFLALAAHLENVYYQENPQAREDIDELGQVMFGEQGRYAIYKRLYGQFSGELD